MSKKVVGTPLEQTVLHMYLSEHKTAREVAAAVGCSDATVCYVLHRNGHKQRGYGGRGGKRLYNLTSTQIAEMVSMYMGGDSCEKISEHLQVPWPTVNRLLKEQGVSLRPGGFRQGDQHHAWAGGRVVRDGYVLVLVREDDPLYCMSQAKAAGVRYAHEHRLVMARHLGRPLRSTETVHHIDGNRQNNDITNLQLRHGKHGKGIALCCADCGSSNLIEQQLS